ncbi:MAG: hypothetical protein MHPDNHAH_02334 [Anaerolineales bacterium]|nr:hypothetical protein [Anaerolineales bacterium]
MMKDESGKMKEKNLRGLCVLHGEKNLCEF